MPALITVPDPGRFLITVTILTTDNQQCISCHHSIFASFSSKVFRSHLAPHQHQGETRGPRCGGAEELRHKAKVISKEKTEKKITLNKTNSKTKKQKQKNPKNRNTIFLIANKNITETSNRWWLTKVYHTPLKSPQYLSAYSIKHTFYTSRNIN